MPNRLLPALTAALLLLSAVGAARAGGNWPCFRGRTGLGYTDEPDLPLNWNGKDGTNVLWSSPLVGQGHASPIVWGDKLFVCTALWAKDAVREAVIPEQHVLC